MKLVTPTRSRKHPLGLTLLSENYKQLLNEFEDFRGIGARRGSSSSEGSDDAAHDDACCAQGQVGQLPSPAVTPAGSSKDTTAASPGPAKSPMADAPVGRQPVSDAAAAAGSPAPAPKQSASSPAPRTLSKRGSSSTQQHKLQQVQLNVAAAQKGAKQQQQQQQPKHVAPVKRAKLETKQQSQQTSAQEAAAAGSKQCNKPSSRPDADPDVSMPCAGATVAESSTREQQPGACAGSLQQLQDGQHAAAAEAAATDGRQEQAKLPPAAAPATAAQLVLAAGSAEQAQPPQPAEQQMPSPQPARSPNKQQQQQRQHPKVKRSRRRVGDSSQPLTATSADPPPAPAPAAAAAAAGCPAVAAAATKPAAGGRTPVNLPRLPLQRLQAGGPLLLPPLHPTSGRAALHSARSGKGSKSEPASSQVSRRTSDSNGISNGLAARGSEPGGGAAASARQHSLPEPVTAALPSSRRHSVACLVEVNRKQQARHFLKADSEGGLLPAAGAECSSVQQRLQPLQPLKQLQELRRRGQLRAGEDSSHDCQILVLDGPPVITASSSNSSCQQLGLRTSGPVAAAQPASSSVPADAGRSWPDLPATGPAHRRTRSSNTQLPSLDERTVLADSGLPSLQPAAAAIAQALGMAAAAPTDLQLLGSGWTGGGFCSRRSSRADSEASSGGDSTAGGLVCEPSSFGVCADPAGAVHLVTSAIPDKLARLKQRLPSRLTADSVAAAAAAVPAASCAEASVAAALQGSTVPAEGTVPAAAKPERSRARWQLPQVSPQPAPQQQQQPAVPPGAIPPANQLQHQQHAQHWRQQQPPQPPPQQQLQPQHEQHAPTRSKSCRQGDEPESAQPQEGTHAPHAASSSSGPAAWGPHGPHAHPQTWDGGTLGQTAGAPMQWQPAMQSMPPDPQQQQQQQQQAGVNQGFMSELRRQLEHWAGWVHMHSSNPQQVPPPPQLPPQLQAAFAQSQQQQYQQQFMQQQLMHQQQYAYALQHPTGQGVGFAGAAAPPPAVGGFMGPVPSHGALSRFTDPWAEKQQQRLMQQRQSVQDSTVGLHAPGLEPLGAAAAGQAGQEQAAASPPPVVSASALVQQRRALQQQAFEGLSLEAVLASAKKSKPPSRKQLVEGSGQQ